MKDYRKTFVSFLLMVTLSFSDTIQVLLSQENIIEIAEEGESSEEGFEEVLDFSIMSFVNLNIFQTDFSNNSHPFYNNLNYQEPSPSINTPPPRLA